MIHLSSFFHFELFYLNHLLILILSFLHLTGFPGERFLEQSTTKSGSSPASKPKDSLNIRNCHPIQINNSFKIFFAQIFYFHSSDTKLFIQITGTIRSSSSRYAVPSISFSVSAALLKSILPSRLMISLPFFSVKFIILPPEYIYIYNYISKQKIIQHYTQKNHTVIIFMVGSSSFHDH